MRLTDHQARAITQLAHEIAGERAQVRIFGSRLDDDARGGDLDLMLEIFEPAANPALLAARFSVRVTRLIQGRKVDVVLAAPNLMRLPIHDMAFKEGRVL